MDQKDKTVMVTRCQAWPDQIAGKPVKPETLTNFCAAARGDWCRNAKRCSRDAAAQGGPQQPDSPPAGRGQCASAPAVRPHPPSPLGIKSSGPVGSVFGNLLRKAKA